MFTIIGDHKEDTGRVQEVSLAVHSDSYTVKAERESVHLNFGKGTLDLRMPVWLAEEIARTILKQLER